jgi:hypothetical protein
MKARRGWRVVKGCPHAWDLGIPRSVLQKIVEKEKIKSPPFTVEAL